MNNTSHKPEQLGPGYSQEDWDEVSDNPKLTAEELAALRPAHEVPEVYDLLPRRGRGRPKVPDAKVNITLRIAPDLLDAYKATGEGWQVRMQEDLRASMDRRLEVAVKRSKHVASLSRPSKQTA
ncbi:BrnA antitoxin family protein [Methylobacterium sp. NPDC080182]|uniref:BrnA antitoxin family protein n=1 Tax=Methylobacterium sp. NPDC080182 TaxID=3390590 RepID=UPI003D067154